MQCFEHAKQGVEKAAVAICSSCGAAVCLEHAVVSEKAVTAPRAVASVQVLPVKAQKVLCQVCAAAENQPR